MKLTIPTAIVLSVVIVTWGALTYRGSHVPASITAMLGAVVVAFLKELVTGLFGSGSGAGSSSSSSSSSDSATPPASPRLAYRTSARPLDTRLLPPRWVLQLRACVLCLAVMLFGGSTMLACVGGVPTPATVQDVTIGLNAAVCVLQTYSSDMAAGKGAAAAILDCGAKCGVSAAQATGLLDAHQKAETLERASAPDAGPPAKASLEDQAMRALMWQRTHSSTAPAS